MNITAIIIQVNFSRVSRKCIRDRRIALSYVCRVLSRSVYVSKKIAQPLITPHVEELRATVAKTCNTSLKFITEQFQFNAWSLIRCDNSMTPMHVVVFFFTKMITNLRFSADESISNRGGSSRFSDNWSWNDPWDCPNEVENFP